MCTILYETVHYTATFIVIFNELPSRPWCREIGWGCHPTTASSVYRFDLGTVAAANATFNTTHIEQLLRDKALGGTAEHWCETKARGNIWDKVLAGDLKKWLHQANNHPSWGRWQQHFDHWLVCTDWFEQRHVWCLPSCWGVNVHRHHNETAFLKATYILCWGNLLALAIDTCSKKFWDLGG